MDIDTPIERRGLLKRALAVLAGGLALGAAFPKEAAAGTEPFLGEIMIFAGDFPPRGWAQCNGQLLPIAQNQALFSLLGTYYGGNGQTTFALPDLRGRVPIHVGQGPALTNRTLGEVAGEETHTLTVAEMPAHAHIMGARSTLGNTASPANALPARDGAGVPHYGTGADTQLSPGAIGQAGGNQPHNNMQPYLALNYCIALQGVFPPRS